MNKEPENLRLIKRGIKLINQGKVIKPNPEAHEKYQDYYEIYRELYPANMDLMHRISHLQLS